MVKRQKLSRNVFRLDIQLSRKKEWEHWHLLLSDVHFDSIKCDRELLKQHLDLAIERKASISCQGDLFDAMQGTLDPRQSKEEIRPEYVGIGRGYLHSIIDDAMAFLDPYKEPFVFLGDGNHETKVNKRGDVSITELLLHDLNRNTKQEIFYGLYSGWLRFVFTDSHNRPRTITLNYHHGSGLKSKAAQHRRAMCLPDADILTFGHHHFYNF